MFRFTIRDVLWLMVVVAMGVAVGRTWTENTKLRLYKDAIDRSGLRVCWNMDGPYFIEKPDKDKSATLSGP